MTTRTEPGSAGARLRSALADGPLLLPGTHDALTARILSEAGFAAVYATGAGFANAAYGWPDVGLVSGTEVVAHAGRVAQAVDVPVVADADTGYGGPLNVARTVRELERHGVAGIQIEDQVTPKRCGHFEGTEVVDEAEMLGRITAAVRARQDPQTVIVGRTDATATLGLDAALARGRMLAAAGADVVFVEAPRDADALARIPAEVGAPTLVNVVEGGRTPQLSLEEFSAMGFAVVLYANTALRLAAQAVRTGAAELLASGDSRGLADRILPWEERQRLVQRDVYQDFAAELQAAPPEGGPDGDADDQEARNR